MVADGQIRGQLFGFGTDGHNVVEIGEIAVGTFPKSIDVKDEDVVFVVSQQFRVAIFDEIAFGFFAHGMTQDDGGFGWLGVRWRKKAKESSSGFAGALDGLPLLLLGFWKGVSPLHHKIAEEWLFQEFVDVHGMRFLGGGSVWSDCEVRKIKNVVENKS